MAGDEADVMTGGHNKAALFEPTSSARVYASWPTREGRVRARGACLPIHVGVVRPAVVGKEAVDRVDLDASCMRECVPRRSHGVCKRQRQRQREGERGEGGGCVDRAGLRLAVIPCAASGQRALSSAANNEAAEAVGCIWAQGATHSTSGNLYIP